jgi:tetratricopeptide (TPR) repeat protein
MKGQLHLYRLRPTVAIMTAAVALIATSPARAQDTTAEASALALNRRSHELYRQGRYAEAATLLREAYREKPEPVLQYNLARACEHMADYACAIEAYESYLANAHPEDRASVEAQLATCRARLAAAAAVAAELAAPPPPPPLARAEPGRTSHSVLPPIIGVVGTAGVCVGLGLVSAARASHADAVHDPTQSGAAAKQDRAESLMRAGDLALIGGAAVATTAIVWWFMDARSGRAAASNRTPALAIHVGAGSFALSRTF